MFYYRHSIAIVLVVNIPLRLAYIINELVIVREKQHRKFGSKSKYFKSIMFINDNGWYNFISTHYEYKYEFVQYRYLGQF